MTELQGTEKQCKWAESIRREIIILAEEYKDKDEATEGHASAWIVNAIGILNQIASAAWWIDHRSQSADSIPQLLSYAVRSRDIKNYYTGGTYLKRAGY